MLSKCPSEFPDLETDLQSIAQKWFNSNNRPKISEEQLVVWDGLIEQWVNSKRPLFVRKAGKSTRKDGRDWSRGSEHIHESGRALIACDNSAAQWVFKAALEGRNDLLHSLDNDEIPVAMVMGNAEKPMAKFKTVGAPLSTLKWKLCHIEPVKLGRGDVLTKSIEDIHNHFRRFLNPRNMFLIPTALGGLGELAQIIEPHRHAISEDGTF